MTERCEWCRDNDSEVVHDPDSLCDIHAAEHKYYQDMGEPMSNDDYLESLSQYC
jgi:hypothetical protein